MKKLIIGFSLAGIILASCGQSKDSSGTNSGSGSDKTNNSGGGGGGGGAASAGTPASQNGDTTIDSAHTPAHVAPVK